MNVWQGLVQNVARDFDYYHMQGAGCSKVRYGGPEIQPYDLVIPATDHPRTAGLADKG